MKKIALRFATIGLLIGATIFSLPSFSHGHLKAVQTTRASGLTWQLYGIPCPGGGFSLVCGPGSNPACFGAPCIIAP